MNGQPTRCAVCRGWISPSLFPARRGDVRWVHVHDEDWVDNVHQAVPEPEPEQVQP